MVLAVMLLGVLSAVQAEAQGPANLDRLDDKLCRNLQTKMPGWKSQRIDPIQGSKGVLIEIWSFPNRNVKIAISTNNSPEEARAVIRNGRKYDRQSEELQGIGDEAYAWGYALSNVAFTRGRFSVYVSTYAEVDSDPDARMLSVEERGNRERSEMRRLSREFAKHLVDAIDLP